MVRGCEGARVRGCEGARVRGCEGARVRGCEGARVRRCDGAGVRGAKVRGATVRRCGGAGSDGAREPGSRTRGQLLREQAATVYLGVKAPRTLAPRTFAPSHPGPRTLAPSHPRTVEFFILRQICCVSASCEQKRGSDRTRLSPVDGGVRNARLSTAASNAETRRRRARPRRNGSRPHRDSTAARPAVPSTPVRAYR